MKNSKVLTTAIALSGALYCGLPVHAWDADVLNVLPPRSAQQVQKITGQVIDETGEPLIGVTIKVKGTKTAAITDLDGNFSLSVTGNKAELELSYIGYKTTTFTAVFGCHQRACTTKLHRA